MRRPEKARNEGSTELKRLDETDYESLEQRNRLRALGAIRSGAPGKRHRFYLTESVYTLGLQKSIPAQICQLILYIGYDKTLSER